MTDENTQTPTPRTGHTLTLAAGVAVVLCLVASATALVIAGVPAATAIALLTAVAGVAVPLVAAVGRLVTVQQVNERQTETLAKIDHQTNGVLEDKMRRIIDEAMNAPIPYAPTESNEGAA